MAHPFVVVVGASAGGVAALRRLAAGLPAGFQAPVLVVLHVGAHRSELPALLSAAGPLPAKHANDGEIARSGQIYIAPPDHHMMIVAGRIRLTRGPRENFARPAIDPLFRSAAEGFGPGAVGVILTGKLNDGTVGLFEIKRRGGIAIAQDPNEAAYPDMPMSAATHVALDYCVPLEEIPKLLVELVASKERTMSDSHLTPAAPDDRDVTYGGEFDRPVAVTCPDCGGALRRSESGSITKYACHIGHAYTAEAMAEAQFSELEKILGAAVRSLNERAEFCRQMAERSPSLSPPDDDEPGWEAAGEQALDRAFTLRDFVEQGWIKPDAARGGAWRPEMMSREI